MKPALNYRFIGDRVRLASDARITEALSSPSKADLRQMLADALRNTARSEITDDDSRGNVVGVVQS